MEELVKQRVKAVLEYNSVTLNKISEGNSALQVKLSRQLNSTSSMSCQTILFILDRFPNVSAEWLLRGEGEMLKVEKTTNTYHVGNTSNTVNNNGHSAHGDINSGSENNSNEIIMKLIEQNTELIAMLRGVKKR